MVGDWSGFANQAARGAVHLPDWAAELDARLSINPQLMLVGNVHDLQVGSSVSGSGPLCQSTSDVIRARLIANGYQMVLSWNPVEGVAAIHRADAANWPGVLGGKFAERSSPIGPRHLVEVMKAVVGLGGSIRIGLILDSAPLLCSRPDDPRLHDVYVTAQHLSRRAPRRHLSADRRPGLINSVIWLLGHRSEVPHWLLATEQVGTIDIPPPSLQVRLDAAELLIPSLPGCADLTAQAGTELALRFAHISEGLSVDRMRQAVVAALQRDVPLNCLEDAVCFIRSGRWTSPWRSPEARRRIARSVGDLNRSVPGQQRAVQTVVDALSRAALGLSGALEVERPNRPRAALHFAGPAGIGKSQLARQVAALVFNRADALIRIDMSDFTGENSMMRLFGILADAVRRDPFRLLLFERVEKAHPRALERLAGLLADGWLAEGTGSAVHVGEAIIVLSSDVGLDRGDYDAFDRDVRRAVWRRFDELGQLALLSRCDTMIVFEHVGREAAKVLLHDALRAVAIRLHQQTGHRVSFSMSAMTSLENMLARLAGAADARRSVRSLIESSIVDPLTRQLVSIDEPADWEVERIAEDRAAGVQLSLRAVPDTVL